MGFCALLLLALALTELGLLSAFLPIDTVFSNWLEAHRSCTIYRLGFRLEHGPINLLICLGFGAFTWLCLQQRRAEARHALLVTILGGFLNELLKTAIERARPSALFPQVAGNSFPSGHISGAVLIAGVLIFLLFQQRWSDWIKFIGAIMLAGIVAVVTWQRLYMMHHWLTDAIGTLLLSSAWLCFAFPRPELMRFSRRHLIVWVGLLGCYQIFYFFPTTRLHLPSILTARGEPTFTLSFNESFAPILLHGSWGGRGHATAESTAWLRREPASIELSFSGGQAYTLRFAAHPMLEAKGFRCFPLEVFVNQQPAGRFLLYKGWREYAIHIDPTWIVAGQNLVTFRVGLDFPEIHPDQRTVEFRYLSLFAEQ